MRLTLVHGNFTLRNGDIAASLATCLRLIKEARKQTPVPDLIILPELAASGYRFHEVLGLEWIKELIPAFFGQIEAELQGSETAVLLGTPSWDPHQKNYYNSAVLLQEPGSTRQFHHKINLIPGVEGWATPGDSATPFQWRERRLGVIICADACSAGITGHLLSQGAEVLLAPTAWGPHRYGPDGEWEARSQETKLPLVVANRTGAEHDLDFSGAESAVLVSGERRASYRDAAPAFLSVEMDAQTWAPKGPFAMGEFPAPEP